MSDKEESLFEFGLNNLKKPNDSRFIEGWKAGICCFCGDNCNELSQCCGRCARNPPKQNGD